MDATSTHYTLSLKILIAMTLGLIIGLIINFLPHYEFVQTYLIDGFLDLGGKIFINILKMLVVPIVFVSLVCGTCSLGSTRRFGRLAGKTILLYILTTSIAITLALMVAHWIGVGASEHIVKQASIFDVQKIPPLKETLLNIVPNNPVAALAEGNMLQVIMFAILFGTAITWTGKKGEQIKRLFHDLDAVIMNLMHMVIKVAPYGVFCLVSALFAELGYELIFKLASYFITVILVLALQLFLTYALILNYVGRLSPWPFYRKLYPAMLFAFSTSSSSASIPVVLNTVEKKLGVKESVASFVVPLGATINMDGTAIMQGVATVFIANTYGISLGLTAFLKVILTATLASVGTAGVPSVGLITLTMVLTQVGLPVEGIALIIGVDRLLDMARTAVNVAGDAMIACVAGKSEQALNLETYTS